MSNEEKKKRIKEAQQTNAELKTLYGKAKGGDSAAQFQLGIRKRGESRESEEVVEDKKRMWKRW